MYLGNVDHSQMSGIGVFDNELSGLGAAPSKSLGGSLPWLIAGGFLVGFLFNEESRGSKLKAGLAGAGAVAVLGVVMESTRTDWN